MRDIDFLEHGGGGLLIYHHGEEVTLPDPRHMGYQQVLAALQAEHVPGTPGDLPEWKRALVFDRWRASWELPTFDEAHRLAYLVDHYRAAISQDLAIHAGMDLGDLWRDRRWLKLLDIIDRLPGHSQFSVAMAMDEEYAEMLARSVLERGDDGPKSDAPHLSTWSPEVAALYGVWDAVRRLESAVFASQGGKVKEPEPLPRPVTALQKAMKRAEYQRRKAAHEALVARVLPRKKEVKGP